jgi:hypothetical protein
LLPGSNHSVLNQYRWGLPHRNLEIARTLSLPFPTECFTDTPKWPCPVLDYPYNKYQLIWRRNKP